MVLLICLIVFIVSLFGLLSGSDEEARRMFEYNVAERRHEELMDIQRERLELERERRAETKMRRVRTIAGDGNGRFVAREVIDSCDEDDFDEDFDEDDDF